MLRPGEHTHAGADAHQTRPLLLDAIDGDAAFVARSHAAERHTRLAAFGNAKCRFARREKRCRDRRPAIDTNRAPVDADLDCVSPPHAGTCASWGADAVARAGANGAASIAGFLPATRSASSRAVASE